MGTDIEGEKNDEKYKHRLGHLKRSVPKTKKIILVKFF